MYRPRVIPVLLLLNGGLVKTTRFGKPNYIGDPMNAVRIFNDLKVDELVLLDITPEGKRKIDFQLISEIAEEAYMPFAYGGGVHNAEIAARILSTGAEKVVLNSIGHKNLNVISEIADSYGRQSIIACMDVKQKRFSKKQVYIQNGKKATGISPKEYAMRLEEAGAGEIMVQSIERDGMMQGYDLDLIKEVSANTSVPVIAAGGAGSLEDMREAVAESGAIAAAAGSLFVYQGPRKGILINYPELQELNSVFNSDSSKSV